MSNLDTIPETKVRLVAALAQAHPRTARRYLEGLPVRGHALRERLARAVRLEAQQEVSMSPADTQRATDA